MAVLKKTAKAAPKAKAPKFAVGDDVAFDNDGEIMQGTVSSINAKDETCEVDIDGDLYEVGFDILEKVEASSEGEEVVEEVEEVEDKPAKKGKPAPAKPAKGKAKGKGSSFASAFNETAPAEDMVAGLPEGQWRVKLSEYNRDGEEGEAMSIYLEVTGVDSDVEGLTTRCYYNLLDDDGNPHEGLQYLKRDLGKFGLDGLEIEGIDDLDNQLQELVDAETEIIVNVKPRKNDKTKMNVFIQGLAD